ncbi:MAG: hypothetical protein OHK0022_52380 [Roseiflexaceae bacterium]
MLDQGGFTETSEWTQIMSEIRYAIQSIVWPPESEYFIINPSKKGNGVKPIKYSCMGVLSGLFGWSLEAPVVINQDNQTGKVDALRTTFTGDIAFEWETGNISSSHRALNKMALGIVQGSLIGGIIVLPTRELYRYLTDRIGNYEELAPYFPIWRNMTIPQGFIMVIAIEHDGISSSAPLIPKGTDGRALI